MEMNVSLFNMIYHQLPLSSIKIILKDHMIIHSITVRIRERFNIKNHTTILQICLWFINT